MFSILREKAYLYKLKHQDYDELKSLLKTVKYLLFFIYLYLINIIFQKSLLNKGL